MRPTLKVESEIYRAFPGYTAFVVYAEGLPGGPSDNESRALLRSSEEFARESFGGRRPEDHEHIQAWRQAFKTFGAKPKRHLCGAEALLQRTLGGHEIPCINRLVDVYNAVSIRWVLPAGGEDWDRLEGDLVLQPASGQETFVAMTADGEQVANPNPREVIWADTGGVTVRRWNWRQCARTQITERTTSAYFVLDRLSPYSVENLTSAGKELMGHLSRMGVGVRLRAEILSAEA
jgi:DNA/RNA-binding domain of Phe-tRNA-synthetase-like protein